MANESRLNKKADRKFQAPLERWLAEFAWLPVRRYAKGPKWSMNPHWMSPIVLSIARPSNSSSDRLMTVTGCCIWLKPPWTAFEM
jgi:hypothetical protein